MNFDTQKMTGEDLFVYYTTDCEDKDYSSIIGMLPFAFDNPSDAYALLENLEHTNKRLCVYYPSNEQRPKNMTIVGYVPEGVLYYV